MSAAYQPPPARHTTNGCASQSYWRPRVCARRRGSHLRMRDAADSRGSRSVYAIASPASRRDSFSVQRSRMSSKWRIVSFYTWYLFGSVVRGFDGGSNILEVKWSRQTWYFKDIIGIDNLKSARRWAAAPWDGRGQEAAQRSSSPVEVAVRDIRYRLDCSMAADRSAIEQNGRHI